MVDVLNWAVGCWCADAFQKALLDDRELLEDGVARGEGWGRRQGDGGSELHLVCVVGC